MNYSYTKSNLKQAIIILATEKKDVRNRLCCLSVIIAKLDENDFPLELKNEWNLIVSELTCKDNRYINENYSISSIENTMRLIRNNKASKIAEKIVNLYFKL